MEAEGFFAGSNGYIVVTSSSCEIFLKNNYLSMTQNGAGFADTTFRLLKTSPLIDAGYTDNKQITFDYYYHPRPYGTTFDIGINEYNPRFPPGDMKKQERKGNSDTLISPDKKSSLRIERLPFPDPAFSKVSLTYALDSTYDVFLDV